MSKILFIQTASIGDVILATALLEKWHATFPDDKVDFLVKKGMEPLFRDHPYLNQLLVWDKTRKYRSFFSLLQTIRNESYDKVINVQRFFLTGFLTAFSGARETRGFSKNPCSPLFSKRFHHEIRKGVHETHRNQTLIADLTGEAAARPRLYPAEGAGMGDGRWAMDDGRWAMDDGRWAMDVKGLRNREGGLYFTVSPGSLWFTKQFPANRWAEVIRVIPDDSTVYFLGSKEDRGLCEEIIKEGRKAFGHRGTEAEDQKVRMVNLAGNLSLLESAELMKGAVLNLTNDSAPMHLASAVNAPVCVFYCSTTPEFGFGPLSDQSYVVEEREELDCRPCGLHGKRACPEKHFNCAKQIDIREVINILSKYP